MLIFDLCFIWRLIYDVLSISERILMDIRIFLFIINNWEYMPISAEMISSLIRKVLSAAKEHMSLGTFWSVGASADLAAISLMSILQAVGWIKVSAPFQHISPQKISTRIQVSMMFWIIMIKQHFGS